LSLTVSSPVHAIPSEPWMEGIDPSSVPISLNPTFVKTTRAPNDRELSGAARLPRTWNRALAASAPARGCGKRPTKD